jgi:uncharacterized membrane protein YeaQ/YmgE (transglycosylase-associated protein family)
MELLSLQQLLVDGLVFSVVLGIIVIGSLIYNQRLWLQDFPAELQALQPPLSPREKRDQRILLVALLGVMIAGLLYSNAQVKAANGGTLSFLTAYLNAFIVFNIFDLFDAIILDLVLVLVFKPSFILLPGSESRMHLYRNWGMHLNNYLKSVVGAAIIALPVAALSMLL